MLQVVTANYSGYTCRKVVAPHRACAPGLRTGLARDRHAQHDAAVRIPSSRGT
jgi:hypothetical protein